MKQKILIHIAFVYFILGTLYVRLVIINPNLFFSKLHTFIVVKGFFQKCDDEPKHKFIISGLNYLAQKSKPFTNQSDHYKCHLVNTKYYNEIFSEKKIDFKNSNSLKIHFHYSIPPFSKLIRLLANDGRLFCPLKVPL